MNPYDNNPFATDSNEIKNEHDANRALVATVRKAFHDELQICNKDVYGRDYAKGKLCGIAQVSIALGLTLDHDDVQDWIKNW